MKMMHKFIFLKKYIPFTVALVLHLIVLSFFLEKPRELVYPDVTTPQNGITFNLKNNFKISYIGNTKSSTRPKTNSENKITAPILKQEQNSNSSEQVNIGGNSSSNSNANTSQSAGSIGNGSNISLGSSDFINYEEPIYPKIAREKNIHGKFSVKISFQKNGSVEKVEFVESSGSKILEESISTSIKKWKVKTNSPFSIVKKFEFKLNE